MPPDRGIRTAGRCVRHPGAPAVGICATCARPLCLKCAVPVRGDLYGPECVGSILGPGTIPEPAPSRPARNPGMALAGIGFAGAVAASVLPWSNRRSPFGAGLFGGWQLSPLSWALLASLAAAAGLAVWLFLWIRHRQVTQWGRSSLLAASGVVVVGALLYVGAPPFGSQPGLGPWVALVAATVGAGGAWWASSQGSSRGRSGDGRKPGQ